MAFDPNWPPTNADLESAAFRTQFTGLKALIDAGAVTAAQTQNTGTLPPGSPATADVALNAGTLTFTFGIPAGVNGEVTQSQLSNDLVNCQNAAVNTVLPLTSANSNGVMELGISISDPPTQAEVQALRDKLNEFILASRR